MRVLFLDTKPRNPNRYIGRAVFDALARHPRVTEAVFAEYRDALRHTATGAFDAFVAFDGEEAHNAIVPALARSVRASVVWFTEDPYEAEANLRTASWFDAVLTNDATSVARYPGPSRHLPFAADPSFGSPPVDPDGWWWDVFFCGTAWPNRLRFLADLRKRLPDVRFKLVLTSNPVLDAIAPPWPEGLQRSQGVSIEDFVRLANRSRTTLVLPRDFSGSGRSIASDTPGPRIFECGLAGTCQLVDASSLPAVASLYEEGRDYVTYRDVADCAAAIERLRREPERARSIAESVQRTTLERHLYDHRAEVIVEVLDEVLARPRSRATTPEPPSERPRMLFVCHNLLEFGHFGGAEVAIESVRRELADFEPWVLAHDPRKFPGTRYALFDPAMREVAELEVATPCDRVLLSHPEVEAFFQRILVEQRIRFVFYSHLLYLPPSLPIFSSALGVPSALILHDHYVVCDRFNLLDPDARYCRIEERSELACDECLARAHGWEAGSQARRRRFFREALAGVDLFIASSRASGELFSHFFPRLAERVAVRECPVGWVGRENRELREGDRLEVALLGNFCVQKGASTAIEVFRRSAELPVRFHLFGRIDPEWRISLERLPADRVVVHGPFSPEEPPAAVFDCHLALFLSIWPETYNIALSEAARSGLVPCLTDLGGMAERFVDGRDCFVTPAGDPDAVVRVLERALGDPAALATMRSRNLGRNFEGPRAYARWLEERASALFQRARRDDAGGGPLRFLDLEELGVPLESPLWPRALGSVAPLFATLVPPGGWRSRGLHYLARFKEVVRREGIGVGLRKARYKLEQWTRAWAPPRRVP